MARKNPYVEHLARVPLFSGCSRKELERLSRHTTRISVDAGRTLTHEGRGAYEFFVIVDGWAAVSREGRVVAKLGPGDFFGELALLDPGVRDATVSSLSTMQIIVLPQWDFEAALHEAPAMARSVMAAMARRLRSYDQQQALAV
jgi:CRP/FNR family cyclic AMP-dependent transcriptional regulator